MDNRRVSLGLVLQNAGTGMKYRETYSPQPMNVGAGAAFAVWNPNVCLNIAVDVNYPYWGGVFRYNLGAELWVKNVIALRAGYRGGYDLANYTFGVGLKVNKFILDYAYAPNYATGEYADYVSPSHKLGITYLFDNQLTPYGIPTYGCLLNTCILYKPRYGVWEIWIWPARRPICSRYLKTYPSI